MIRIPLLNKLIESKPKPNKELKAIAKQVRSMSKHPKWIEFINSHNGKQDNIGNDMGGGESKKQKRG